MRYVEAPMPYTPDGTPAIFLAGGITGTYNWQAAAAVKLSCSPLVVLNPRRANFPMHDPDAAQSQIAWEYEHLRKANGILFWFPSETLCPITLYELGTWSMATKPIFVGVHAKYQRRADIEIQTSLVRPEVQVVYSLDDLCWQVLMHPWPSSY